MSKPSWTTKQKDVYLSDTPKKLPTRDDFNEAFLVYHTYGEGRKWWTGWKTYSHLWTALRYGVYLGRNKDNKQFVRNLKTNEIVWRSWEDENPYQHRV